MKLFGSITELVSAVFRKNSQAVTLRPNQTTTYSASRDVQLPEADSDQVMVGRTSADQGASRLKNKDLEDSTVAFVDDGDATKKFKVQASGITTGTTRTMTVPDADFTPATTTTSQNVQNKTLDNTNTVTLKDTLFTLQDDGDTTKQAKLQLSGLSTGTTRTFTLPDVDDSIVTLTSSATGASRIQNKEFDDSSNAFVDDGDTSKKMRFQLSGITTATVRTLTVPDASTTLLGTDTTAVVTNKDIDGGTASNTHRITLPKDTTTNINALTRKQGTIIYDTSLNQVKYDNGTVLTALASASTATPTASGSVTSYSPIIQSAILLTTNGNATVNTTDGYHTYLFSTGNINRILTLSSAATDAGRVIIIKKTDSGTGIVTITRAGSDTIDGATTMTLRVQYAQAVLVCDGTATWHVVRAPGPKAMVRADTPNGHGSSLTKIRRWTNFVYSGDAGTTAGQDIVSADSSTGGTTFTINAPGVYAACYTDLRNANCNFGIALNGDGTTSIDSLAAANRLGISFTSTTVNRQCVACTFIAAAADVVTAYDDGNANGTSAVEQFTLTQVYRF